MNKLNPFRLTKKKKDPVPVQKDNFKYSIEGILKGLEDGTDANYMIFKLCRTWEDVMTYLLENHSLVKSWTISEKVDGIFVEKTAMTAMFKHLLTIIDLCSDMDVNKAS